MRTVSSFSIIVTATMLSALWLSSCCNHKNADDEPAKVAINMGISSKGTRAIINDKSDMLSQCLADPDNPTGFGVFGYKTIRKTEGETTTVTPNLTFDNFEVVPTSTDENATWTYSPLRYWDSNPNASYQFAAYWPHLSTTSGSSAYVANADQVLTIYNIPFWQDATLAVSADFMTDKQSGNYSLGDFNDPTTGEAKVRFTFSHILAKLVIRAYYTGVEQNQVTINGMRLTPGIAPGNAILNPDGKATYTMPYGSAQGTAGFTGNTPTCTTSHPLFSPVNGLTLPTTTYDDEVDPEEHEYQEICTWLMVPCTGWDNLGLSIDYSIAGSSVITTNVNGLTLSTTVNDVAQTGLTDSGKAYIVTLKFNSSGGGVDLQSVLVKKWHEENWDASVFNW